MKHFSRSTVTEKSFHLIIAPMAPKQHSSVERGRGTFGAKPVLTTHLPRVRVLSCTLILESSISLLRRYYDPEGIIPPLQHWVEDQEPTSQKKLVSGTQHVLQHFEETCTPPAMPIAYPTAISWATGLGTDIQLPLGPVKEKLWNNQDDHSWDQLKPTSLRDGKAQFLGLLY